MGTRRGLTAQREWCVDGGRGWVHARTLLGANAEPPRRQRVRGCATRPARQAKRARPQTGQTPPVDGEERHAEDLGSRGMVRALPPPNASVTEHSHYHSPSLSHSLSHSHTHTDQHQAVARGGRAGRDCQTPPPNSSVTEPLGPWVPALPHPPEPCRGTSLIRNRPPPEDHHRALGIFLL